MRHFIFTAVFIICSAPLFAQAAAHTDALNLSAALERTYVHNPTLRAARSRLMAVQEQLPQALAGWRPTLSGELGISNGRVDSGNTNDFLTREGSLALSQPLYKGGSTFAQVKAARATIRAQEEQLRALEQDILLNAVVAYVDVVRDQALLNLSRNNRNVIERQREATQDRFDVGELTLTDVSQAEARLARANSEVTAAKGDLKASKAVFEQVIGAPAQKLVRPRFTLSTPNDSQEAVMLGDSSSPAILATEFSYESSQNDIDNAFGDLLPDIDIVGALSKSFDPSPGLVDETTSRSIGVLMTIPLYQAGATRSRVREAKHTANQRYIEVLEAKRLVRQQIVTAWETLAAAQAEIISRRAQVKASEVAQEGVHAEAEIGVRTVLDSLNADQELLDAQVALVTAQRNELVAQFALAAILGNLSPETLGFEGAKIDHSANTQDVARKIFDMNVDRVSTSY